MWLLLLGSFEIHRDGSVLGAEETQVWTGSENGHGKAKSRTAVVRAAVEDKTFQPLDCMNISGAPGGCVVFAGKVVAADGAPDDVKDLHSRNHLSTITLPCASDEAAVSLWNIHDALRREFGQRLRRACGAEGNANYVVVVACAHLKEGSTVRTAEMLRLAQ